MPRELETVVQDLRLSFRMLAKATYVTVALILVAVAGLASFLPARRATAGDPTLALHND